MTDAAQGRLIVLCAVLVFVIPLGAYMIHVRNVHAREASYRQTTIEMVNDLEARRRGIVSVTDKSNFLQTAYPMFSAAMQDYFNAKTPMEHELSKNRENAIQAKIHAVENNE